MAQVKFRKRKPQIQSNQTETAIRLRELGVAISRRRYADSLSGINDELKKRTVDRNQSGRLLALAADAEFKKNRYAEAAVIYQRAASELAADPRSWIRPLIGQLRALLSQGLTNEAATLGDAVIEQSILRQKAFASYIARAEAVLAEQKVIAVPPAPIRPTALASRMASLFLLRGEVDTARNLFQKAIDLDRRGSVRARAGLARIALAEGDAEGAFRLAREAIIAGNASAKTISCWPVLVAARRKLGGWLIGEDLIDCLKRAPLSVRARATVVVAAEMRKHDMRQWQTVALEWLESDGRKFPAAEAEIKKMILASWKTIPGHYREKLEAAKRLLQTKNLSRNEWLSAIKEMVHAELMLDESPDLNKLITGAINSFDTVFGFQVRHALALTCMKAGHHKRARILLDENIGSPDCPRRLQSKSSWAYGRMERALGDHESAARAFLRFADNDSFELRFRIQARLLWVDSMVATGQIGAIMAARDEIIKALEPVEDAEMLMNTARQIRAIAPEMNDLAFRIFDRAKMIQLANLERTDQPAAALEILFKLTRRMVCDFDRHDEAVRLWEEIPAARREWIWEANEHYYEYLGLLVTAYSKTGKQGVAEKTARQWLGDPAVPPHGRVYIGIALGHSLIDEKKVADALVLFSELTAESPAHPLTAFAWYWLALEAHKAGDADYRNFAATSIRRALGSNPGLLEEWKLDARALLLLHELKSDLPADLRMNYDDDFMARELGRIHEHLSRLPR